MRNIGGAHEDSTHFNPQWGQVTSLMWAAVPVLELEAWGWVAKDMGLSIIRHFCCPQRASMWKTWKDTSSKGREQNPSPFKSSGTIRLLVTLLCLLYTKWRERINICFGEQQQWSWCIYIYIYTVYSGVHHGITHASQLSYKSYIFTVLFWDTFPESIVSPIELYW